jgi:tetratricopeptide (TPR) repeat protein
VPAPEQPVTLPDLSAVAPAVRQQIQTRYDALRRALDDVAASTPQRASSYGDLGAVLLAATFFDEAARAFQHAEALEPREMRWPYLRAHALVRKGDRESAVRAFERAAALQPTYLPALVWAGDMYLDLGQDAAAQEAFARALSVEPASAAALFGAGRAALARGAYEEAADRMERALRIDPGATAITYPLATAQRHAGHGDRADALLKSRGTTPPALEDPVLDGSTVVLDSAVSHESVGMQALRNQDWAGAIRAFRAGLEVAPDDPSLRYWMASAMIAGGDAAGAEREFRAIVAAHPEFAKAHFSLGAILDQQGRRADAAREYELAARHDPTMVDARVRLGDTLRALNRPKDAFAEYQEAVRLDPNAVAAWLGGARALIDAGDGEQARTWIARGRRLHPSRPEWDALP